VAAWRACGATVVVTQGERGATLLTRAGEESFPAFPVEHPLDPTGAGDAFAAAFLRAWWWGDDQRSAMRFANAVASFVVERQGAGAMPTYAEAMARLHALR
jgi:sugar/nucleoside kinase (ribokinase family)